jgi:hypothetical protein
MDRRNSGIVSPAARVQQQSARRIGMVDVAEQRDRLTGVERRDAPLPAPSAQVINFKAVQQGTDYTVSSAASESPPQLIPGTTFTLPTPGQGVWLFDLSSTALVLTATAATVDVVFYPVFRIDGGSWLAPDLDDGDLSAFPRAGVTTDFQYAIGTTVRRFVHARGSIMIHAGANAEVALFAKPLTGSVTLDTDPADARYRPRIAGFGLLCAAL